MSPSETIVNASIEQITAALSSGRLTSVELTAKYLQRVSKYDCRNTSLNSIPLLNENVFEEAASSDDRRAAGKTYGPLDGIPFTVKDSYKVKGMTVASGSEAFQNLIANEDAFTVAALRGAGAVLIGKTNMCPMAYGGMLRGLYGRAESPYNSQYLTAAFGSGSSNGSGTSTAASFAAFSMGEETVSSGRSPASNNALIAYTPSRGIISIRGNWPLYPTCDVVVPHARSMSDLLVLLDVLVQQDETTVGDFWRDQPFLAIPQTLPKQPTSFTELKDQGHLQGKRIAVPHMYINQSDTEPFVSISAEVLWKQAQADLEAAGATIEIIDDFPAMEAYTTLFSGTSSNKYRSFGLPENWNNTERGHLIAHAWEDFLQNNEDPNCTTLQGIDYRKLFPRLPSDDPQVRFTEPANAVHWSKLAEYVESRPRGKRPGKSCIYDVSNLEDAVKALEEMRKLYFEKWLDQHEVDYVVFPAVGDVAKADADIDFSSAKHAWTDGVKYSHGNRMLRHLGIPSVTVPMGLLEDSTMPMGLTFLGRAYDDVNILTAAYAYEQKSQRRTLPPRTPQLPSDQIPVGTMTSSARPQLSVTKCSLEQQPGEKTIVSIEGTMRTSTEGTSADEHDAKKLMVDILIDGSRVSVSQVEIQDGTASGTKNFRCQCSVDRPPTQDDRNRVVGKIARDSTMIMILARNGEQGRPTGFLKLVHNSEY